MNAITITDNYLQSELEKVEDAHAEIEQIREGQNDEQAAGGHLAQGRSGEGDQTGGITEKAQDEDKGITDLVELHNQK